MSSKSTRNYAKEYASETPARKRARAARNRARRKFTNALAKKVGRARAEEITKGKDIDHKVPLVNKVTEKKQQLSNLRLRSPSANSADKSFRKKKTSKKK